MSTRMGQTTISSSSLSTEASVVDLFCGVGGLTRGLEDAGLRVVAGIDNDADCAFSYEQNNSAKFIHEDLLTVSAEQVEGLWARGSTRVLVGCAPCQPYSKYSRGSSKQDPSAPVQKFAQLVETLLPAVVSMENVPAVTRYPAFAEFIETLQNSGYHVSWDVVSANRFGVPQTRKRLVLVASRLAPINAPVGDHDKAKTVREAIGSLPPIRAGEQSAVDPTHRSSALSSRNLERIQHSAPGGTWRDWPESLRSACHQQVSGATFPAVYGRMQWDAPAPTMTTQFFGYGNGRFGHPEQDRAISLREGAILQTFPPDYQFENRSSLGSFATVGKHIGNAVPVALAKSIGETVAKHLTEHG